MKRVFVKVESTGGPVRWLRENMDRRHRTNFIILVVVGGVMLLASFVENIFSSHPTRGTAAVSLFLIIIGFVYGIVSVLKDQQRRLQALESKRGSEPERP